jgi:hypothetical protein
MDPRTAKSPLFVTDDLAWLGLAAGPIGWFVYHVVSYALVPWSCDRGSRVGGFLVMLVALLVVAGGGVAAWRDARRRREVSDEAATPAGRARFLAHLGLSLCLLFALVIVMEGVGKLYFDPCQR